MEVTGGDKDSYSADYGRDYDHEKETSPELLGIIPLLFFSFIDPSVLPLLLSLAT
jgi:hypothetical protein